MASRATRKPASRVWLRRRRVLVLCRADRHGQLLQRPPPRGLDTLDRIPETSTPRAPRRREAKVPTRPPFRWSVSQHRVATVKVSIRVYFADAHYYKSDSLKQADCINTRRTCVPLTPQPREALPSSGSVFYPSLHPGPTSVRAPAAYTRTPRQLLLFRSPYRRSLRLCLRRRKGPRHVV